MDIIPGKNPVYEALTAGIKIEKIMCENKTKGDAANIVALANKKGVLVEYVSKESIDHIGKGLSHQGIIAMAAPFEYAETGDILDLAKSRGEPPFIIILDHIEDPHNLGAILRTAETAGAHGVIIPGKRAALVTPAVHKVSAGAVSFVPVAKVSNIGNTVEQLKKAGLWIYCLEASGKPIYTEKISGAIGLVIGGEGVGVSSLVRKKCDFTVSIPMQGKITSLNASVSAGIAIYEIIRQRSFA